MRERLVGVCEVGNEGSDGVVAFVVNMDDRGGSFVAVRRISQGLERGNTCHSTSGKLFFSINSFLFSNCLQLSLSRKLLWPVI